jgi:hypothetical protein
MVKAFVRQFPLAPTHVDMKPIFAVFVNICLLRRGPELVPTHPLFVGAVVIADMLLSFYVSMRYGGTATPIQVATGVLVSMATVAAVTWIMLSMRDVIGRYPATITALFGCQLLFTLLSALLMPLAGESNSVRISVFGLIAIWSIAVDGFILHRALNVTVLIGILLALCMGFFASALSLSASGGP